MSAGGIKTPQIMNYYPACKELNLLVNMYWSGSLDEILGHLMFYQSGVVLSYTYNQLLRYCQKLLAWFEKIWHKYCLLSLASESMCTKYWLTAC